MDNLAHSLVGWALGEAGLKHKTGLGLATLIIAANLPDIDVLGFVAGENLAFRRGITHGPLAMAAMPPLLAGAMVAFDRWQTRRGTRPADRPPVRFGWLFALAFIGVLTHPALDYLNVYGVRLLMPFSDRWFYGDTLFIVDVWLWLALALGIGLSRWRERHERANPQTPAFASLIAAAGYIGLMGAGSAAAERHMARAVVTAGYGTPREIVTSAPPFNPFRRDMIYDVGTEYGFGAVWFTPAPHLTIDPPFDIRIDNRYLGCVTRDKETVDFMYWSRLPFLDWKPATGGAVVVLQDARFVGRAAAGPFRIERFVPDTCR